MRSGNSDLTILKAIIKSSLHIPPLSSLNLTPPPQQNQPQQEPPPELGVVMQNHNELAHHNYYITRYPFWNHNLNENPNMDFFGVRGGVNNDGLRRPALSRYQVYDGADVPDNNWAAASNSARRAGAHSAQNSSRSISFRNKYDWYREIASKPRSLQHYCRYTIRTSMGHKRLRHVKDLPIPTSIQQYLFLEYDEYK